MAGRSSMRAFSKMIKESRNKCIHSLIQQSAKRNSIHVSKGLLVDSSVCPSGTRVFSSSVLQNFMKTVGSKSSYKFKISEMQRCVASLSLVSKVASPGLIAASSDGEMLEGSEDGDDVCSQGKKYSRSHRTKNKKFIN